VSEFALGHGLPLIRPEDCNSHTDSELIRTAAAASVDRAARDGRAQPGVVFVVIAFGQKMSPELLSDVFSINLHGSLLPRWRGAAPVQRALMEGDPVAGVSVIALAERMDAGVVYAEEPSAIGPSQTSGELHDALSELGPDVVASVLHMWRRGDINARAQDESRATRARKLSKADAWVDLSMDAFHVRARINGLNPWPGCAVEINGAPMQIRRCEVATAVAATTVSATDMGTPPVAGTITPDGILTCGTGAVRILEVQAAGGRILSFAAWAHGARIIAPVQVTSAAPTAEL
jgi:methionyl-tRNA formyltransferase